MDNIQEPNDGSTVVGDGDTLAVMDELVHTTRTQRCLHDIRHDLDRIDVADQLALA